VIFFWDVELTTLYQASPKYTYANEFMAIVDEVTEGIATVGKTGRKLLRVKRFSGWSTIFAGTHDECVAYAERALQMEAR
jgi:hypothetical protein